MMPIFHYCYTRSVCVVSKLMYVNAVGKITGAANVSEPVLKFLF